MIQPALVAQGGGRYALAGELNWRTVPDLLREASLPFTSGETLEIDLTGVEHCDSAGLALFAEWLRQAKERGAGLRLIHPPEQMKALAKVSGVLEVLPLR